MSGSCKHFISLITILICKSVRVGQRNWEPVASWSVCWYCSEVPGLVSYSSILDVLETVLDTIKTKSARGSEALQIKAGMEVCA